MVYIQGFHFHKSSDPLSTSLHIDKVHISPDDVVFMFFLCWEIDLIRKCCLEKLGKLPENSLNKHIFQPNQNQRLRVEQS